MLKRTIGLFERAFGFLSGLAIFAVMIIVCVDVGLRYAFNAPLPWAFDLISMYLMVGIFFLTLAPSYADDFHIRIDLLIRHVGPRTAHWLTALQILLALPFFVVIAWFDGRRAWVAFLDHDVVSGPIAWPTWPESLLVSVGSILLSARLLVHLFSPPRYAGTPMVGEE